jgi:hypothetical protein
MSGGGGSAFGSNVSGVLVKVQIFPSPHSDVEPEVSQTVPTDLHPANWIKAAARMMNRIGLRMMNELNHMGASQGSRTAKKPRRASSRDTVDC